MLESKRFIINFLDMSTSQKLSLFLLRLALGWLYFYSGIIKIVDPQWSVQGYLKTAKTFPGFYQWLTQPDILPFINFMNKWSLLLLGISLILGLGVRISASLGIVLMLLYYLPILDFPYIKPASFLVDQHIIFILVLIFFIVVKAGKFWGLDAWYAKSAIFEKFPKLKFLIG